MTAREELVTMACSNDLVLSPDTAATLGLVSFCSSYKIMLECGLSLQCVAFSFTRKLYGMLDVVRLLWESVSGAMIESPFNLLT